ncbi:odorant receptor 131-2-like [Boleophthalmus pectinirostris]|uniref:odorant receptor 131-2-like n=1 Tax=Boleophthalmus pectinirostris TaxID=150288 RepID=UPI00242C7464|nr:odorant receptor 131-2-like [Boleophthalmus pectinirostris]
MELQNIYQNLTGQEWTMMITFKFAFVVLINLASLMFLVINGIIIHTLCSRPAFRESPRYMLLLNLVVGDSIVLFMGQLLYMKSTANLNLSYPLCGFYIMISYLSIQIAPLTLTVMSIERYISVCFPFHHPTIVTTRNTAFAVLCVWGLGCVDILVRVLLLLEFPFHLLPSLQMNFYCVATALLLGPRSKIYETISTVVLFLLSGLVIASSFIGVMVVAISASTDKVSADKARNTLLLHTFQLSLNLLSTMGQPIYTSVAALGDPILTGRLFVMVHVFVVMMPRCLSALTYGLKDPSLRPVLVSRLCCHLQACPNTVTAHTHDLQKKTRPPSAPGCTQSPSL